MKPVFASKYHELKENLKEMSSVVVAFSGGVDSTLVLAVGKEALGGNVVAATIHSPLHPSSMLEDASRIAERLRVEQISLYINEFEMKEFTCNPRTRCYICKRERYSKLLEIAKESGFAKVVDGTQLNDTRDFRPGIQASRELGIRSPLLEVGFQKYEVRAVSRELGLSTWNAEGEPCLATRIPYGQEITIEKVEAIEDGEKFLRGLGMKNVRVRYVSKRTARIEVNPSSLQLLISDGIREKTVDKFKSLGFTYVAVDLACFRSGSMNEELEDI
ncbi:MAG: ATP-dependent sacrificial sulfur transferase LarE [Actinomycetota bacterium]|nr:ATP-dependent sacrificial sulfur transferase LarE [Actinomycetota bacterium]